MADTQWLMDVRAFRAENNLTQHDLAIFLGVSQKTISRWERGVDQPGLEIRKRLETLLADGTGSRMPALYEAVRDAVVPLALIDGAGTILVASRNFSALAAPPVSAPPKPLPTVLVVEDDCSVLKATRAALKRWNFLSTGVDNGDAALKMVTEGCLCPSAAIIDFLLPGALDGVDLADTLREMLPDLPILIISGEATPERMRKISASGYPFIAKPVNPDDIKLALLSLLPQDDHQPGRIA